MKTQNSRAPIPYNGKHIQNAFAHQVVISSWHDQPDLSDEPGLPELEVDWDEIPEKNDDLNLSYAFSIEHAIIFLLEYWTKPSKSAYGESSISDEEWDIETNRQFSERIILEFLSSEKIHEALKRIRSHQIDIELQLGHEFALHTICILVELLENAKRHLEEVLNSDVLISKNCCPVPDEVAIGNYSALIHLLPQLYQVREFISLQSILNTAEAVELAHFLFHGGCFKKGAGIGKIRKDIAQMFGIVTSELTLNTIAHSNQKWRTELLFIKRLMRNWDIEQEKIERVKTEKERLNKKK